MSKPKTIVEVATAIITRSDGSFLLTRRPGGKPYSGYWEFPGGKIEHGESTLSALKRELHEELGIEIVHANPWITRVFNYVHATVRLYFFRVVVWRGELRPREHQTLSWQFTDHIKVSPILPANAPILRALSLPPVYAITQACVADIDCELTKMRKALQQGIQLLQIREKSMEKSQLRHFALDLIKLARQYHATVLINGNIELAQETGADGVHFTAAQLMELNKRPQVNWCGASCHNIEELFIAEQLELDFVVLGPIMPTLSHPGLPTTLGWQKFTELIRNFSLPVYALGGLRQEDLSISQQLGGHGIAMISGINQPVIEPP